MTVKRPNYIKPIFLYTSCQFWNWSILHSDWMASSILELAVGRTFSVGCTQNVVNFYTSCQGRSPKSTIECSMLRQKVMTPLGYTWGRSRKTTSEFKMLWQKVTTLWGYTRRRSMRSTTEWGFFLAERLNDHKGQGAFGVSEGVATAHYSAMITEGRRLMGSQMG